MGRKIVLATAAGVAALLAGAVLPTATATAATAKTTVTVVPCRTQALARAVSGAANGATLSLAKRCRYVLTAALPTVARDLTINGHGSTLHRSAMAGTPAFTILTITAGTVTLNHLSFTNGNGAITVDNLAKLNVRGGVFRGNTAANGGAIENLDSTVVQATGVSFIGNKATGDGGAMYVFTALGDEITNCKFLWNTAAGYGGAFSEWSIGTGITDSTFRGNKAATGGALAFNDEFSGITGTVVEDNSATGDGGGIADSSGGHPVSILNSKIIGNRAGGSGGGLDEESGSYGRVTNTTIAGNSATKGGGINDGDNAYTLYTDDKIYGNYASGDGGGIALSNGHHFPLTSSFAGGTISGNYAGDRGGGLYTQDPLKVSGTAINANQAGDDGGGIFDDGAGATVMLTNSSPMCNEPENCGPPGSISGCTD